MPAVPMAKHAHANTALRMGQFWRSSDASGGALLEAVVEGEGVLATGYDGGHGAIWSVKYTERAFRHEFPVLLFDPQP